MRLADHIDFYSPEVANADQILGEEANLRWSHETGGLTTWISVWFANTEAKLRTHTIIDSCIRDLLAANERIKGFHLLQRVRIPIAEAARTT